MSLAHGDERSFLEEHDSSTRTTVPGVTTLRLEKLVVSGLRAEELAHYSEAMTATQVFHVIRRINIINNSRGLKSDPDKNAGFSLAGNVIMSK